MAVQPFYSNYYLDTPVSVVILDYLHTVYTKLLEISMIHRKEGSVGLLTKLYSVVMMIEMMIVKQ